MYPLGIFSHHIQVDLSVDHNFLSLILLVSLGHLFLRHTFCQVSFSPTAHSYLLCLPIIPVSARVSLSLSLSLSNISILCISVSLSNLPGAFVLFYCLMTAWSFATPVPTSSRLHGKSISLSAAYCYPHTTFSLALLIYPYPYPFSLSLSLVLFVYFFISLVLFQERQEQ